MRILVTNDDGIHSEGLDVCADIGARAVRRRLGRGAGIRPVGRVAFALAQRSAAAAAGRRAAFRRQRHADRLRDHGRASHSEGPPARPRAVRRQPRPQCRRGRDLFGHGGGRGRRHHPRHPVVCAVASLHVAQRPAAALGHRREVRPGHHPARARRRHSARRADQHQLSELRAGRGEGHRRRRSRAATRRSGCRSRAARTAAAIPTTGSCTCARARSRRSTAPISRRSPPTASRSRHCASI